MDFPQVIKTLNKLLRAKKPEKFTSSWILENSPPAYRFIHKNVRTENNHIDWDKIVSSLNNNLQSKWVPPRYKPKVINFYRNKKEVEIIIKKYQPKLYVFITILNKEDDILRNTIIVSLVRIAQRGNRRAEEKLTFFLKQIIEEWLEKYSRLSRWVGHTDQLDIKIKHCIYWYRFTGSFLGYLYKTLEYSAWALKDFQGFSLDSYIPGTTLTMADTLTKDPQSGRVVRAKGIGFYYFH
jgi:hypothetical protein